MGPTTVLVLGAVVLAAALPVFIAKRWTLAAWATAVGYGALVLGHQGMWIVSVAFGKEAVRVSSDGLLYICALLALVGAEVASAWLARPATRH